MCELALREADDMRRKTCSAAMQLRALEHHKHAFVEKQDPSPQETGGSKYAQQA
jgi:hypothetical protein